jgi:hypothetical protein
MKLQVMYEAGNSRLLWHSVVCQERLCALELVAHCESWKIFVGAKTSSQDTKVMDTKVMADVGLLIPDVEERRVYYTRSHLFSNE